MAILTISRTFGCGAREMARALAQKTGYALFEKEIVPIIARKLDRKTEYTLEHDQLKDMFSSSVIDFASSRFAFLKKDTIDPKEYREALKDLFMKLLTQGNAIIVGRGSQIILQDQPGVIHIRLMASMAYRVEHLRTQHLFKQSESTLIQKIRAEDKRRKKFLETHFQQNGEDPLLYHLIINLSKIPRPKAEEMILGLIESN